jgi:hypothetical protein
MFIALIGASRSPGSTNPRPILSANPMKTNLSNEGLIVNMKIAIKRNC